MKRILSLFIVALVCMVLAVPAFATNGYQLIGVGQIQKSMGGAVTAAPMDAMTAITNPAGMSRIGSRVDFSMEAFMPKRSVDFSTMGFGGESTSGGSNMYGIPAIGWTAPAFDSEDIYFGGGMFGTSGLGVDYGEITIMGTSTFIGYSSIQFWKMAPTVAVNINDKLSVGGSLNMDYQSVTMVQKFSKMNATAAGIAAGLPNTAHDINFDLGRPTSQMGFGLTFGVLYDLDEMITLGASYSTKQNFSDAEYRLGSGDLAYFNGAQSKAGTYKLGLDYPQQFAVGVAVTPSEKLLVAFDIKWINWSSTHDKVSLSGPTNSFATSAGFSDSTTLPFGWEDQWVYAIGLQYAVNEKLNVRAGYNYAKAPIDEADVFNNLIMPATVEKHLTLGADYAFGEHWGMAVTYMTVSSNKLKGTGDVSQDMQTYYGFGSDSNITIDLKETSVGTQLFYKF
jgi:long-chain fatty acid transport protein